MIRGLLSFVVALVLSLAMETLASAEPVRLLVAVGHRSGLAGEAPLKHATRDATRVRDLFVKLGGVRPEHAVLLEEPSQAQLFAALERTGSLAKARRREDVSLVFYFSGHGDREALHLGSERVALRDLDVKLASITAGLRIIVTDACRTVDVRGKGVTADAPFAITVEGRETAVGVVRVHASTDGEIAQESDELGGAIFTHYWLTALSGAADVNADGRVTFEEAYGYAYGQTLFRSVRGSGVVQRPDVQSELVLGAPLVLTVTAGASGIRVPKAADVFYVVYAVGSRTVAGELWSSPDRVVALAVPPGRYVVQRRVGGRSAAMQLDLGRDEQRSLSASDFQDVPQEVLARKGGELVLHPSELELGYGLHAGTLESIGHEGRARYAHAWDSFALGAAAFAGAGSKDLPGQESAVTRLGVDLFAELRLRAGDVVLFRFGGGPRASALLQTIRRDDAERLSLAGYEGVRRHQGLALGGHALAGARVFLTGRLWVDLDLQGELLGFRQNGSLTALASAGLTTGVGLSF